MTETHAISPAMPDSRLPRFTAFLFGGVVYLTFLFTILYAIGFVSGLVVPKAIDTGAESGVFEAILVNLVLMSLFAIQHSAMARKSFRHRWTQFIPGAAERRIHVLCASLTLLVLFWQWRPMPDVIWHVQEPELAMLIATLSFVAWVVAFTGVFLINPSELFGRQRVAKNHAAKNYMGRPIPEAAFRAPIHRRFLHQPICPAIIVAFWATPTMSVGHLLLAAAASGYIFSCILLEERDPIDESEWRAGPLRGASRSSRA
jgi:protein-S-isoprenylcysteine O-methyltransferase Ste14